jgi:hypothetical protein
MTALCCNQLLPTLLLLAGIFGQQKTRPAKGRVDRGTTFVAPGKLPAGNLSVP